MTPELETLARRAVACKHWKWLPGMLAIMPEDRDGCVRPERVGDDEWLPALDSFPDLSDPATLGCLLALVRKKYPSCYAEPNGSAEWDGFDEGWRVYSFCRRRLRMIGFGPSEAAALVAALEGAP